MPVTHSQSPLLSVFTDIGSTLQCYKLAANNMLHGIVKASGVDIQGV